MRPASVVLLAAALLSGCVYSFTGGGLPRHIRTVAVIPFENTTTQPLIESDIERSLQAELPRNLGVRLADERAADAVLRGRINSYEESATSVRPSQQGQVPVVQREVRISYDAEIYDLREDRPLWRAQSQTVTGNYSPESETVVEAKTRAIRELVKRVIEGAQSQW